MIVGVRSETGGSLVTERVSAQSRSFVMLWEEGRIQVKVNLACRVGKDVKPKKVGMYPWVGYVS